MRILKYCLFVVLIIGFMVSSACTSSKSDSVALLPELAEAESIMYEHPDSALHILESMSMPNTADKFQHATWALLMTQARYKNYMGQSDTLINMAYDYFINKEDAQRKAMVLYYKGAICEEKHQIEEALQYYVEATKEIEKTNDYQLAHLIYAYLGNVYVYRSFGEFARDTFEKALYYAKLSQNDLYVCASYGYLAKAYTILHDQDETIRCYKEAIQIAEEKSYNEILAQAMTELAAKYTDNKDYELAWDYARRSLALKQKMNAQGLEQSYLILGDLFRHMGEADSAYYYLYKSLSADHVLTTLAGYRSLYYLSKKEKDYEKMGIIATRYGSIKIQYGKRKK